VWAATVDVLDDMIAGLKILRGQAYTSYLDTLAERQES
jgi:hypothetical protein